MEEQQKQAQASNIFVSFSKRRKGLFQKATELCTTFCDAQIAIVILSTTGNPFSFGHSSVDDVLRHYLGKTTIGPPNFITDEQRHQIQRIERLKL
ncbi:MADS-box transcription factor [Trema orientale]|uniref:MADS-box transcription factor n=1 Tax=Trema orientale TaxID=63057 RepID=A0A2P5EF06_TREOI|nr:MADS-box transcription factor [Trema orientale]